MANSEKIAMEFNPPSTSSGTQNPPQFSHLSIPGYSQFMHGIFTGSRLPQNREILRPIVEGEESAAFCPPSDSDTKDDSRRGQLGNFNPAANSFVASAGVGGCSRFEGNVRVVASSTIPTQGKLTPRQSDALDQIRTNYYDDDQDLSSSECSCSSCCGGSESEDEVFSKINELLAFPTPQQSSIGGMSVSLPPGFQRGLHGREEGQDHPLNSSINHTPPTHSTSATSPTFYTQKTQKRKRMKKCQKVGSLFHCKICLKPSKHQKTSKYHEYTHMTWAELEQTSVFHKKCAPCDKIFLDSGKYTEHVDMHAGRKPHKCPHPNCQKSFTHQSTLASHKQIHLNDREKMKFRQGWKHKCYFCTKKFPSTSHLHTHLAVHTREKPFQCDHTHNGSKCSSSFTENGSLKQHKRLHLENRGREFPCAICDKIFTYKNVLSRHVKTVHEKKRDFKCPEEGCGKEFGTSGHLKTHRETVHLRLKPHKCQHPKCNKTFGLKSSLNAHVKRSHKS